MTQKKYDTAKPALEELAFVMGKIGWQMRFCDLTEDEVHVLVFAIQEAKNLSEEVDFGKLEEKYYQSTGTWPPTSIPF